MLALIHAGERSNSNQVSPKGAAGVAQMMPENLKKFGVTDPTDPVQSIDGMARYLKATQDQYGGNQEAMAADYNGGPRQAAAVLRGERPPAAETAAYLDRVREYMANRVGDDLRFSPSPQEVDAALMARGQRIVDDAYVFGRPDDITAMTVHQDAFELAARQMDAGQFPDVARFVSGDDSARATALDSLIAEAEAQRTDVAQQVAGLADQGAVSQMRAELDQIVAARPDDSAAGVKELTRQLQDQGMKYKAAAAKAQKQIDAAIADHDAQVQRLRGAIEENARAQQAHQQLGALDAQLADLRTARAGIDAPATRRTPLSKFVEDVVRAQTRREPVTYREPQEPVLQAADTLPAGVAPRTASGETLSGGAAPSARAIDANLRDAAALRPDMQVTVDTPAGERTGTVAELMQQIDDEHAMNTQDAGLFEVAANCFISLG
ncbi:transglycosylase SLT domain-containing protein [Burkholderia cenocepacia]|uniref:transglycosylase SLT domain-containing protein n=1 Tax=Burkholderia cenocepacia TaxID=95486 RepID=UPI0039AFF0DE